MRTRLLEHLLADPGRGGPARLGRLLQRFSGELQAIRAWPGRGLPRLLSEGVLVLACAAAAVLALPDLVRGLSVASLVLPAGGLFGDGGPSPGVLAASLALLAALVPTLRELARLVDRHAAWRVACERLERLLRRPPAPPLGAPPADQPRQPTARTRP